MRPKRGSFSRAKFRGTTVPRVLLGRAGGNVHDSAMDTTHPLRNATMSIELEARVRNAVIYLSRTRRMMSSNTARTASPDGRLRPDSQRLAVERPQPVCWMRNRSVRRGTANLARSRNSILLSTERDFLGPFLDPFFPRLELDTDTIRRLGSRDMMQHPPENRSIQLQPRLHNLAARYALRAMLFHRGTAMHDDRHLSHPAHGPIVDPRMPRFRLRCVALLTQNGRSTDGCEQQQPVPVRGNENNGDRSSLAGAASCPGLFSNSQTRQQVQSNPRLAGCSSRQDARPPDRRDAVALVPLDDRPIARTHIVGHRLARRPEVDDGAE